MNARILSLGVVLAIAASPLALHAEPDAAAGRPATAPISPPPAAAAGSAGNAMKAASDVKPGAPGAIPAEQRKLIQRFVVKEKKPSASVAGRVEVGVVLPNSVELYPLPADLNEKADTRYTIVNERAVLVEAKSRKVTDLIN